MTNKMKLVPIEPTNEMIQQAYRANPDAVDIYKAMTAECPTVEEVNLDKTLDEITDHLKKKFGLEVALQYTPSAAFVLSSLTQNGYKIVKVSDDR